MPILTLSDIKGQVDKLYINTDRNSGLETEHTSHLHIDFAGIQGEAHSGLTYVSDSRIINIYPEPTEIKNSRQISIVSCEELAIIAHKMQIPHLPAHWLGANIATRGIEKLTHLPSSTRLVFSSGAVLTVDLENYPCHLVAKVIESNFPGKGKSFPIMAKHLRGIVCWVEKPGNIHVDDSIRLFLPPQR